jgi:hypothetical protein
MEGPVIPAARCNRRYRQVRPTRKLRCDQCPDQRRLDVDLRGKDLLQDLPPATCQAVSPTEHTITIMVSLDSWYEKLHNQLLPYE